eukprot:5833773-Prymnesium_polylepis.1
MPYDPSLAAQPSAPAANLCAPLKADESWRSVVTTHHVPLLILPTTTCDAHWHPPSPHHPYTSTGIHIPQTRHVPRSHVPYHVPSH